MEMSVQQPLLKSVGRVSDAHGLKGELYIRLFAKKADWLENFTSAYLISPDAQEVREIEVLHAQPHRDGLIVRVKDLEDRTPAEALKGYALEIPSEMLVSQPGEDIYLDEIIGFKVIDSTTEIETNVAGVASNGPQDLLVVSVNGEERMIPFVKDFIEKVDFEARTIRMNLPLGLLTEM